MVHIKILHPKSLVFCEPSRSRVARDVQDNILMMLNMFKRNFVVADFSTKLQAHNDLRTIVVVNVNDHPELEDWFAGPQSGQRIECFRAMFAIIPQFPTNRWEHIDLRVVSQPVDTAA